MTDPARTILIASFPGTGGAASALDRLKGSDVKLGNVALVKRETDGSVDFSETQDWGMGKSAVVGALAGLLLPGVGTITMAAGGALAAYFLDLGFPDNLLKQMGEGLTGGTSMLVALVAVDGVSRARDVVTQAGGTVLGSTGETDLAAAMATMQRST
jgi:uncharacterized membrane protein